MSCESDIRIKRRLWIGVCAGVTAMLTLAGAARGHERGGGIFILTSTNDPANNNVAVFKFENSGTPTLSLWALLPTGGAGGATGNAGALQFGDEAGAVVNYGSNTVTKLVRRGDSIATAGTVNLASGCLKPVSVALRGNSFFVAGANCAESHDWFSGGLEGRAVQLPDASAAQIAVGKTWAAVTLGSGSVLEMPLAGAGALDGTVHPIALPANANSAPLGAAFWEDTLAFNPAHSPDSFALVSASGQVFPVPGPQPSYPTNAPCWLAKGPGNIWYSGNSPGQAISVFFSDSQGGTFYKSLSLPGVPTDITVSEDGKWLAVIYTAGDGSGARVAVYSINSQGDLTAEATSGPIGVASFNGVAISE